jgi:hypothetical protein
VTKKNLLDRIDVREPCNESWEQMTGNDQVRFCSHCSKNVVDLSSYTRQRAEKLVRDSNGNLCVRYQKDERGRVITAPPKFTQIKRQAKIAAGVLAATLSVASAAYTQGSPRPISDKPNALKHDKAPVASTGFIVSGVVTDVTGAVIPNADVTLVDKMQQVRRNSRSNLDGEFSFRAVGSGDHQIEIESPGFKKAIVSGLEIVGDTHTKVTLEVGDVTTGLLVIEGEPLVCDDPPVVTDKIEPQKTLDLPKPTRIVLGALSSVDLSLVEKKPAKKSKKKLPK